MAILIPAPISETLSEIQNYYRPPRWVITLPPHITLVPPFQIKAGNFEESLFHAVPGFSRRSFNITLSGINSFKNNRHIIFLNVVRNHNLDILQKEMADMVKLRCGYGPNELATKFIPHVTLVNRLREREASTIKQRFKEMNLNFEFRCNKISLMSKRNSDQIWHEIAAIHLAE